MSDGPRTLTCEDRHQLREFVRVVSSMSRRRFMERFRQQDHSISCRDGDTKGPDYDRDDLEAFLTDFRKVAMSKSESIYLTKIIRTVGRYASTDLRSNLARLHREAVPLMEGRWTLMEFGYRRGEEQVTLTPQQIMVALVNGEIFHVDPAHVQTARELRQITDYHYLWPALHFFVIPVVKGCVWLYHAIRRDGVLGDSDYPDAVATASGKVGARDT